MSEDAGRDASGLGLVALYGLGWLGVLVGVNALAVALTMLDLWLRFGDAAWGSLGRNPALPGWVVVLCLFVQFGGMLALVPLVDGLGRRMWPGRARAPWVERLGLERPRAWAWIGAIVVGATAGWLPGRVAEFLRDRLPWLDLGALESLQDAITGGPIPARVGMWIGVVLVAPIAEEVLFRGWMWDVLRRGVPPWAAWLLTSLLFAAYHIDPIHGSALLFTALALGWVRWMGGSLLPCIAIHAINNALGVVAAHVAEDSPPPGLAIGAALLTVAAAGQLHIRRVSSGRGLDTDDVPPLVVPEGV